MLAIYKKEIKSYFTSMIGYVFIAFFLLIVGIYCMAYNLQYPNIANFEMVLSRVTFLFFILIPVLTMRLMAEERRQKTDQLLFTSPLSVEKIVIGKFLAVATIFIVGIVVIMTYPLILSQFGSVQLKLAYDGILGFALLGIAYLALGLFISSCTESQVVSAAITFVVILVTNLMSGIVSLLPTDNKSAWIIISVLVLLLCGISYLMMHNVVLSLGAAVIAESVLTALYFLKPSFYDGLVIKVLKWVSTDERFASFLNGTLDFTAILYYVSFAFLFVFLTIQSIKKRRWR